MEAEESMDHWINQRGNLKKHLETNDNKNIIQTLWMQQKQF